MADPLPEEIGDKQRQEACQHAEVICKTLEG
jgi:hypothetical protein